MDFRSLVKILIKHDRIIHDQNENNEDLIGIVHEITITSLPPSAYDLVNSLPVMPHREKNVAEGVVAGA